MEYRVYIEKADINRVLELLPAYRARAVIISAVNDAGKYGETRLNRLVRETLLLSRDDVDDAISRVTVRDEGGSFAQKIIVSRKPIPLKRYNPRQTKLGVVVRMVRGGTRELIRSAFISQQLGDHVYKRLGKKRLPVRKLGGATAIGAVLRRPNETEQIMRDVATRLVARFQSKLDYVIGAKTVS